MVGVWASHKARPRLVDIPMSGADEAVRRPRIVVGDSNWRKQHDDFVADPWKMHCPLEATVRKRTAKPTRCLTATCEVVDSTVRPLVGIPHHLAISFEGTTQDETAAHCKVCMEDGSVAGGAPKARGGGKESGGGRACM